MIEILTKRRTDDGFTLVELLIVIVILGILAAIVVFAVGGITDTGQTSACKSDYKSVVSAEEAYFTQHNSTYIAMDVNSTDGLVPKFLHEPSAYYFVTLSGKNYSLASYDDSSAIAPGTQGTSNITASSACAGLGIPPS